jgi:hypothetical protein
MKRILLFSVFFLSCFVVISQNNRSSKSLNTITGLENGSVSFVDYDNDGDMDMLLTGSDSSWTPKNSCYIRIQEQG